MTDDAVMDKAQLADETEKGSQWFAEGVGLDQIRALEEQSYSVIERLRETAFAPDRQKELRRRFSITQAAAMVGRTTVTIREAEKAGRLPEQEKDERGRRRGYTLEQVNLMRREFGTLPWRADDDEPVVLAVQNFKGGVGKSTLTVHIAQYLALNGYRICVIDCDPQGSTTSLFGVNPDYDLDEDDTLVPFLIGNQERIEYAVRDTYWDQLKLIPSNLSLYSMEYQLAARLPGNALLLDKLRNGIATVIDDFDIVLIDPPPALGMISLSVLRAANALVVPVRPATIDFGSTAHFFTMLAEALAALEKHGMSARYKFLKVLANDMDENKSAHTEITRMMQQVYGSHMLATVMRDSAEIDNAGGRLLTVYELEGPMTSKRVHDRCKVYLNAFIREIETLIRQTWPSHRDALRQQGLL
jgi:chromosome partitioning protein